MRMFLISACMLLGACVPQSENYAALSKAYNAQMVGDAVQKMAALYPPASTCLIVSRAPDDTFGKALETKLREKGYAIKVNDALGEWWSALSLPPAASDTSSQLSSYHVPMPGDPKSSSKTTHAAAPVIPVSSGIQPTLHTRDVPLSYIIDQIGNGYYRISLNAGSKQLSRVYTVSNRRLIGAGAWALKE